MGKLQGKVAVITGGSSGMALATAKKFVDEGAHIFITGRRQDALDEAVASIGQNVTGVQGDAANLDDLDRLYETVKREKGTIDVLFASAGVGGDAQKIGTISDCDTNVPNAPRGRTQRDDLRTQGDVERRGDRTARSPLAASELCSRRRAEHFRETTRHHK